MNQAEAKRYVYLCVAADLFQSDTWFDKVAAESADGARVRRARDALIDELLTRAGVDDMSPGITPARVGAKRWSAS